MSSNPPSPWRTLALLFAGALLLRLLHLAFISDTLFFSNPIIDEKHSVDTAWAIAQGDSPNAGKEFWKPPLYEYFLAGVFTIGGKALWLPRLFQALLDSGTCVLTFLLACRLLSTRAALAAGIAVATNGVLIYFTGELVSASLAIFLDLALLLLLFRAMERPRWWRWLAAGAVGGLCALARAEMLLMIPIAAGFAALAPTPRPPLARRALAAALVTIGAVIVISPATWHNHRAHGAFVPVSTNGGINLYVGTVPAYHGMIGVRPGPEWEALVRSPLLLGHDTDPEVSDYYRARALAFMREHPGDYAAHVGKKLALFFHGHELASNHDLYTARRDSPVLAALLFHVRGLYVPFGLIGPLSLLGIVLAWRRPGARLLLAFLAVQVATVALFFVTARFRAPSVPLFTIFAVLAATWLWEQVRAGRARHRPFLAAAGVTALCFVGSNCGAAFQADRDHYRTQLAAERRHFRGTALFASYDDRYAEAAREFEAALRIRPTVPTYFNYGRTLLLLGRNPEGVDALVEALILSEGDPGAEYMRRSIRGVIDKVALLHLPELEDRRPFFTGFECFNAHEWSCALGSFEALQQAAPPGSAMSRGADYFLARSLTGKGVDELAVLRYRSATTALERAAEMRPDDSDTRLGLGFVYSRTGRTEEAREQFLIFRRVEPVPGSFFYGAARPDNDMEGTLGFSVVDAYVRIVPDDAEAQAARAEIRRRKRASAQGAAGDARR